ncbi:hypothetical protein NC653_006898 [Populus alba x Populus x berolinensis]|uniref:Uncharacterized protein n=1 Tax=Populus alba x Populus x berolinensis TaxID=444605 RepID=A0AAD6WCS5_9ROSI|nr:hypothetical protein NC653_006898 [Populus alba x Populus x berolinensis]
MDYSNNNPYLQSATVPPATTNGYGTNGNRSTGKIRDALNRCGKRVELATRKAEVYADNIWHHREFSFPLFMLPSITISDFSIMFLTRFTGRTLLAAAKSETPAASAAAATATSGHNPLKDFFEFDRSEDGDKPIVYGRSWKASELRLKGLGRSS